MNPEAQIQLNNLTKVYTEGKNDRSVLDELDLSVKEGEILVLLGRSGSGKSTLLNLISGIDKPDSGEVIIGRMDLTKLNEKDRTLYRRKNIGFVFQSFNLVSTLTAEENVHLPLTLKGQDDSNSQAIAQKFLDEVGLGDRCDSYPDQLSGGEQQRVAPLLGRWRMNPSSFLLMNQRGTWIIKRVKIFWRCSIRWSARTGEPLYLQPMIMKYVK